VIDAFFTSLHSCTQAFCAAWRQFHFMTSSSKTCQILLKLEDEAARALSIAESAGKGDANAAFARDKFAERVSWGPRCGVEILMNR
jgi:hypothetical protein